MKPPLTAAQVDQIVTRLTDTRGFVAFCRMPVDGIIEVEWNMASKHISATFFAVTGVYATEGELVQVVLAVAKRLEASNG